MKRMKKTNKKVLTWCLVVCMIITQMIFTTAAFAATTRHEGADRYETAAKIAAAGWTTSDYAVLATGEDFPDALCAAPLAKAYNAPILLTESNSLNSFAKKALTDLKVKTVFVVGGPGAVSESVVSALTGMEAIRIWGTDRYDTSLQIAKALKAKLGTIDSVFLATGSNFADALSASPIAAAKGMPILLAEKDSISDDIINFIDGRKVYIAGGTGVIGAAVANEFDNVVRLGGVDRYYTNVEIMNEFKSSLDFSKVFLATGENYPDALAGSVLAANAKAPLVLVGSTLNSAVKAFLAANLKEGAAITALGGAAVVPSAVVSAVENIVPNPLKVTSCVALNHQTVMVTFNQELTAVDKADFVFNNGLIVTSAAFGADKKTVYLTTTSQTTGVAYSLSYKGGTPMAVTLVGTTGYYNSNIQITGTDTVSLRTSVVDPNDANHERGRRLYTVNVSQLIGKVNVALIKSGNFGLYDDGSPYFVDDPYNALADGIGSTSAFIEEINSVSITHTRYASDVVIPSNGVITVAVNSYDTNEAVRLIVWQDTNANGQLDLDADDIPTEPVGVSGVTAYIPGADSFGGHLGITVQLSVKDNSLITSTSATYYYDSNDTFQYGGVAITMDQFVKLISVGDTLSINYNPTASGVSVFNITAEPDWNAPTGLTATVRNTNKGSKLDDVRLAFTPDANINIGAEYTIQRASTLGADGIHGTADDLTALSSGLEWKTIGTLKVIDDIFNIYDDLDLANGAYIYRMLVVNPVTGNATLSNTSNEAVTPGSDTTQPMIAAFKAVDKGMPNMVDGGDIWYVLFNKPMNIQAGSVLQIKNPNEYTNFVLGTGNTFTTATKGNQTLLTVTLTDAYTTIATAPNKLGYLTYAAGLTLAYETGLNDLVGNTANIGGGVAVVKDVTAPDTLSKYTSAGAIVNTDKSFNLTFTEPMDLATLADKANYTVVSNGLVNPITSVTVSASSTVDGATGFARAWTTVTVTTLNPVDYNSTIAVNVKDLAGNAAALASNVLVGPLAANNPVATIADLTNTTDTTPLLSGTYTDAEGVNTVTYVYVSIDGGAEVVATLNAGNWTYAINTALGNGTHTASVRALDNTGRYSATVTDSFVVDTVAPVVASATNDGPMTHITFTVTDAHSKLDGASVTASDFVVPAGITVTAVDATTVENQITITVAPALAVGQHVVLPAGSIKDKAGNESTVAFDYTVLDKAAPTAFTTTRATNIVTLTFAEAVMGTATAADFEVFETAHPNNKFVISGVNITPAAPGSVTIVLTLAGDPGVSITATIKASANVTDTAGNALTLPMSDAE